MRILFFGDSITQGFWDIDGGWVSRIRKTYDRLQIDSAEIDPPTVFNLGVSGNSSNDLLQRIESEIIARATEELAIVIAIGFNDARTKSGVAYSDIETYVGNLAALLRITQKYSDKILFVGLSSCDDVRSNPVSWGDAGYTNERVKQFDYALQEFCLQNNVPFADVYETFYAAASQANLVPDSIHPNEEGHQIIADIVLPKLNELLS